MLLRRGVYDNSWMSPESCFAELVCEHASTLSNRREIYSSIHDDTKSAGVRAAVVWGFCVWERRVHPATDTLKKTSKRH